VDIIYGAVNPSGRLPYTIGKSINDYGAKVLYSSSQSIPTITYTEGLNIDYRWFDSVRRGLSNLFLNSNGLWQNNIVPRYEFGYGLSYTTFSYSNLKISGEVGSYTPPTGPGSSLDAS
jgi:hypothetical protein